jgi:Zn-finger nucleic acid-binding protein
MADMKRGEPAPARAGRVPIQGAERIGESDRRCPSCGGPLLRYRVQTLELDGCPACGGAWFDAGELRALKDRVDRGSWGNLRWLDEELDAVGRTEARPTPRTCPRDAGVRLLGVRFGPTDTVLDWCPTCRGIWLDHGEFDRIVAYLRAKLDTATPAELRAALVHELAEIVRGPEGPVSEALDAVATASALMNITILEHPTLFARLMDLQRAGRSIGL